MILTVKVSRQYMSHIQRIVSLNFFITASLFSIFAIEPEKEYLSDRLSISFTLVLSALVFMFIVDGRLPNVPYLTLLDTYIYASFYLMMFMTLGSSLVIIIPVDIEDRMQWNRFVFYCSAFVFLLLQVWFIFVSRLKRLKEKTKLELSSFNNFDIDNTPQLQISSLQEQEHNRKVQKGESSIAFRSDHEFSYRGKIFKNSFHSVKYE